MQSRTAHLSLSAAELVSTCFAFVYFAKFINCFRYSREKSISDYGLKRRASIPDKHGVMLLLFTSFSFQE
jgi:hypothetical protein